MEPNEIHQAQAVTDKATRLLKRFAQLEVDRKNFEAVWQEIIDFCLPRRADIYGNPIAGTKRGSRIYDSTPNKSLMRLASALNSMLTNPASKWFGLHVPGMEDNKEVDEWLEDVRDAVARELSNSNFYSEAHELYLDLASLGTAIMYIAESSNPERALYFNTMHLREGFVSENSEGEIDTLFRRYDRTCRQLVEEFGESALPKIVKEKYEKPETTDEIQQVLHIVMPRDDYQMSDTPDPPNKKKFASITIHISTTHVIKESGYDQFPFVTPRWLKSSGEMYGRSPAWDALADIKTLNAMEKTMLRMGQKMADPPVQMPDEGYTRTADLRPSGVNYYRSTMSQYDRIEPINLGGNMPLARDMLEDKRTAIKDAFFDNNLHLIDKREMTAQEVSQRSQENMRVLGPTFSRLEHEYLEGVVERTIPILKKKNLIPDPPDSIRDKDLKVRFISPIAKAQRMHEVQAIEHTVRVAAEASQQTEKPEILDNIDFDKAINLVADLNGTPPEVMRGTDEIEKIRGDRAADAAKAQESQMNNQDADTAQKVGAAAQSMAAAQSAGQGEAA